METCNMSGGGIVRASGGASVLGSGAGGGGRISLKSGHVSTELMVIASGGVTSSGYLCSGSDGTFDVSFGPNTSVCDRLFRQYLLRSFLYQNVPVPNGSSSFAIIDHSFALPQNARNFTQSPVLRRSRTSCGLCPFHSYVNESMPPVVVLGEMRPAYGSHLFNVSYCRCNLGYTGDAHDEGVCVACAAGAYKFTIGSASCSLCGRGTYSTSIAAVSDATCLDCPPHSYSGHGSNDINECSCNSGYIGPHGGPCLACPTGTYRDATQVECQNCGAGKYSATEGNSAESGCIPCAAGTFSIVFGANDSDVCQDCGPGKYAESAGNDDESDCIMCGAGKFSNATGADNSTSCQDCDPGKFSAAQGNDAETACVPCASGKYSVHPGATEEGACVLCETGKYASTEGNWVCQPCQTGTYSNTTGAINCTSCFDRWTTAGPGFTFCFPTFDCLPGTYRSMADGSCPQCVPGSFSAVNNSASCTACEAGKHSDVPGSVSCTSRCGSGFYSTSIGEATFFSDTCHPCPRNFDAKSGSISVTNCACAAGYFGSARGPCSPCPSGTYKANAGAAAACTRCPIVGQWSPTRSVSLADCMTIPQPPVPATTPPAPASATTDTTPSVGSLKIPTTPFPTTPAPSTVPAAPTTPSTPAAATTPSAPIAPTTPSTTTAPTTPPPSADTRPSVGSLKTPSTPFPTTPAPSPPAAPANSKFVVTIVVTLPYSKENFDATMQEKFKSVIAKVVGAAPSDVIIQITVFCLVLVCL